MTVIPFSTLSVVKNEKLEQVVDIGRILLSRHAAAQQSCPYPEA